MSELAGGDPGPWTIGFTLPPEFWVRTDPEVAVGHELWLVTCCPWEHARALSFVYSATAPPQAVVSGESAGGLYYASAYHCAFVKGADPTCSDSPSMLLGCVDPLPIISVGCLGATPMPEPAAALPALLVFLAGLARWRRRGRSSFI